LLKDNASIKNKLFVKVLLWLPLVYGRLFYGEEKFQQNIFFRNGFKRHSNVAIPAFFAKNYYDIFAEPVLINRHHSFAC